MVIQEKLKINGKDFVKSYSSIGMKIHGGSPISDYDEAIDPSEFNRQYVETEIPIDKSLAEAIVDILLGGAE